ncbi:MAG: radical SAM protein, partial [Deltaproteobacteria bacterium]|nr:radical SAM protein [Deltaproteobacteria bacterium]
NEIVRRGMVIQFESFNGYNLASLDEEIVAAMVEAGCVYVIPPIEHANEYIRNKIIGKHLSRDKIYEVVALYKKYNLLTRGLFIMGFPEDTRETLDETHRMILDLNLDMNNVFNLIPFPGTKVFEQARRDNLFLGEVNADRLWEGAWDLNAVRSCFYLKPYQMTLEDLEEYRKIFDGLRFLTDRVKAMQTKK